VTILVVGKTGQLARSLADAAPVGSLKFAGRPELDLATPGEAAALIADLRPELVINAAAYTQVDAAESERDLAFRINADAAGEIAQAAAACGAAIIQVSTDYVFDGRQDSPYTEDDATNPINVYGASKLAGEEAVHQSHPDHIIVRTSWLVSPYGHNFVKTMLRLAEDRDEVAIVADQVGRPTVVDDLADAILQIARLRGTVEPGIYHLAGGGEPASWADLAEHLFAVRRDVTGSAPTVRRIGTADYPAPAARPRYSVLDCGKAEQAGLSLPDWRVSVARLASQLVS
jgi:dTDP-4-dehydrorhamnose reductase